MSDTYGVVGGASNEPGLPQINLPSMGVPPPQQRQRIDVPVPMHPDGAAAALPEYAPTPKAEQPAEGAAAHLPEYAPEATTAAPERQTTAEEAQIAGAKNMLTFGMAPAISGLGAASGIEAPDMTKVHEPGLDAITDTVKYFGRPVVGAVKTLINSVSAHPDPAVKDAYTRGRDAALADQNLMQEQHPAAYLAGQLAGGLVGPAFGAAGKAATALGRIGRGALAGGTGGALYGGGSAVSEGADVPGVAEQAVKGGVTGATLGGVLGGIFGRRAVNPNTPGQRAARTAQDLGAPLPKGLATDTPWVAQTAQQAAQIPVVGARMGRRATKTVTAAGERIEETATGMAPARSRSVADATARPAIEGIIDANKAAQDAAYSALRGRIDLTKYYTMPRTRQMLDRIKKNRAEAGWADPAQGLDQFENAANGATFNGAHRARADARNAGKTGVPHPGYDAGDYRALVKMMTLDLRNIVQRAARGGRQGQAAAAQAFDHAESEFGKLAEQNDMLDRLLKSGGENVIATIMGAAREKGGNISLLGQLRAKMAPKDFEVISGTLLNELGQAVGKPGEFSLNRFTTEWKKLSEQAKTVLFSPAHKQMIDDIAALGEHIKGGDQYRNTSNTAGAIILWDVIRAAGEGGIAAAAGYVNPAAAGMAITAAVVSDLLTRYMASPAGAAAIGTWTRAYQALQSGAASAARQAAFVMATRNLANTLGVPIDKVADIIRQGMPTAGPPPQ